MRLRGKIIIIVLSIVVYLIVSYIYNNVIVSKNMHEAYMVVSPVKRGDTVLKDNLKLIRYESNIECNNIQHNISDDEYVFCNDYLEGSLLTKNMVIKKGEYVESEKGTEIVAIEVSKLEDNVSHTVQKGEKVNIYVTAKTEDLTNILNMENVESFSNNSNKGYTTVKILSDVEILNCYDSEGKIIQDNNSNINIITLKVNNEKAIKINNLKNYAVFTLNICNDLGSAVT